MQKSIEKMAEELKNQKRINERLAERLKAEMEEKHPDVQGLQETYEIVASDEEDATNGAGAKAELEEQKVGGRGAVLESKKTGITRQSLLKAAHDSVYSGSDFNNMRGE